MTNMLQICKKIRCPLISTPLDTIQSLQKELGEHLDNDKYERMVDYYDNVLRERAADLEDLQNQVRGFLVLWLVGLGHVMWILCCDWLV